ncbi:endonuclease/exonuclease/phosphatase family protein [Robertkochia solimangrovi]|uniref:endonuclease/exonuclease/phosphatase family protein n=1 Tax=Robertkochia solimangrovi TaxID=2213046 RepID=UPI00117F4EC3|nr:endonuclease/exonuclease/phosphatase family protein [Robertkochia solimangrovi]TRZ43657.1 endonuclease/exonuclease/phosphatase [Robertkochia solimangrovi]
MKRTSLLLLLCLHLSLMLSAQEISVMTYNIKYDNPGDSLNNWDHRKAFMIDQLQYFSPDIFGTQEGLKHQLEDLKSGLKGYDYVGIGRDEGNDKGEFTAVFYRKKAFALLHQETFWLSATPEKPSKGWDAALNRICTVLRLKHLETGREFMVFNTHFDHIGNEARVNSAALIINKATVMNPDHLPVIVMGDLNLTPESEPIRKLNEVFDDSFLLAKEHRFGPIATFNGFEISEVPEKRIDYIFLSRDQWKVIRQATLSETIDARFISDHFPVLTHIRFEGK